MIQHYRVRREWVGSHHCELSLSSQPWSRLVRRIMTGSFCVITAQETTLAEAWPPIFYPSPALHTINVSQWTKILIEISGRSLTQCSGAI